MKNKKKAKYYLLNKIMGLFYQQYLDCGRELSDFYTNTPRVSTVRNNTPQVIYLRWDSSVIDNTVADVEFFNYDSILPTQTARTFTTRGSFGIYPKSLIDNKNPDRSYEKRTRYMEGWNDAILEVIKEQNKLCEKFGICLLDGNVIEYIEE